MTMSRRDLFGWLRGVPPAKTEAVVVDVPASEAPALAPEPSPVAFSLESFYATRTADQVLPEFAIRATITQPTTRVGVGRTEAAATIASERTGENMMIAPGLVPVVLEHRCLATRSFCSVCVERCPTAGALVVELGRPRVDPARCDGCGRCVAICPAPVLAFALVPRIPSSPR